MDPITLAAITSAVVTLALDATKDIAKDEIKGAWTKVKGWLGWTKTPPTEELATQIATALNSNAQLVEQILAELKSSNAGAASKLASQVTIHIQQSTDKIKAGGKVTIVQGKDFASQGDMNIGGG